MTSAELDRPLALRARKRLGVHRPLRAPCRLYRRQLALLQCQAAKWAASAPDLRLDEHARDRIRAHLRDATDNGGRSD